MPHGFRCAKKTLLRKRQTKPSDFSDEAISVNESRN
jgi:hypothetical protein